MKGISLYITEDTKVALRRVLIIVVFVSTLVSLSACSDGFKVNTGMLIEYTGENSEVILPDNVTSIGRQVFSKRTDITSITIPEGVLSIGDYAFHNVGLTSITIPDSVTSIGYRAFEDSRRLTNITIGNGLTSIGDGVFNNCISLVEINVGVDNFAYSSIDGVMFDKLQSEVIQYPQGNPATSYTIPNSVVSIGNMAFKGASQLVSITFSENLTSIGNYSFSGCVGLTEVVIPNSVKSVGTNAFSGCINLSSVQYDGVTYSVEKHVNNSIANFPSVYYDLPSRFYILSNLEN